MSSVMASLPQHVAIIMDGNGRWAQTQGKPRLRGHQAGAETLRSIIEESIEIGIAYLTVYAFSTENWNRPVEEVNGLMSLLKLYLEKELRTLQEEGIKVRFIGNRVNLSLDLLKIIQVAEQKTEKNTRFTLIVAFNYGSRNEILRATQQIARLSKEKLINLEDLSEETFSSFLDTRDFPDPEILIRTSGESRISNFLLWQCSYAELFFTQTLWPDFSKEEYRRILSDFAHRERRCGKISEQLKKS